MRIKIINHVETVLMYIHLKKKERSMTCRKIVRNWFTLITMIYKIIFITATKHGIKTLDFALQITQFSHVLAGNNLKHLRDLISTYSSASFVSPPLNFLITAVLPKIL